MAEGRELMDITLRTGCQSDDQTINVDWFDHNGVQHRTVVVVGIHSNDKPRTLYVNVDGVTVHEDAAGRLSEARYREAHR